MSEPSVVDFEKEGEALYEEAETFVDDDNVDIVRNDVTEEMISVTTLDMPHFEASPVRAASSLFHTKPIAGRLWPDEETIVLIAEPAEHKAAAFANRHTPGDIKVLTRETGYRYVDDNTSRGGLVYREDDHQFDQKAGFLTRPWAEENPEDYVEFLAGSEPVVHCKLLDEAGLQSLGFERHNGEFEHGMYRASSLDDPAEIRDELEREGWNQVVFSLTRATPFEVRWNTYVRNLNGA